MSRKRKGKGKERAQDSNMDEDEDDGDGDGDGDGSATSHWDGPDGAARTWAIINALQANPTHKVVLFSDSNDAAKEEGRERRVYNVRRNAVYYEIAQAVFPSDLNPNVVADWNATSKDTVKWAKKIRMRLSMYVSIASLHHGY